MSEVVRGFRRSLWCWLGLHRWGAIYDTHGRFLYIGCGDCGIEDPVFTGRTK